MPRKKWHRVASVKYERLIDRMAALDLRSICNVTGADWTAWHWRSAQNPPLKALWMGSAVKCCALLIVQSSVVM